MVTNRSTSQRSSDLDLRGYQLCACIGKAWSGHADVRLARDKKSSEPYAMRVISMEKVAESFHALQYEACCLRQFRHSNIISLTNVFISGQHIFMVMPLMDYGSVTDIIHARFIFGLPEQAICIILRQVLCAIAYLHKRDIVHRSIRCSHILLSSGGHASLSGFRYCTSLIENGKRVHALYDFGPELKSSLLWLAPEILTQNMCGYGLKSDIYSLGITACEMANGFPPFSDMEHMQMLLEKLRGTTPRLLDVRTCGAGTETGEDLDASKPNEHLKREFSSYFHEFTDLCLRVRTVERPSAAELLNHPFFKPVKKSKHVSLRDVLHPLSPLAMPSSKAEQSSSFGSEDVSPGLPDIEWDL